MVQRRIGPGQKMCCSCHKIKALEEYAVAKSKPDGRQNKCRRCAAEYRQGYKRRKVARFSATHAPTPIGRVYWKALSEMLDAGQSEDLAIVEANKAVAKFTAASIERARKAR